MVFFKFFSFFFFLGGEGGDLRQIDLYVNEMLTIILKKSTLKGDYSDSLWWENRDPNGIVLNV